jgi:hypothetical protein
MRIITALLLAVCWPGLLFAHIPEHVLLHRDFIAFRNGDHREFLEPFRVKTGPGKLLESSRLDSIANFKRLNVTQTETVRSLLRSNLRELTSDAFYVAPAQRLITEDDVESIVAVLHFQDGNGTHYMLIRSSDQIFTLKTLKPIAESDSKFLATDQENYLIDDYVELAALSKNRRINVAVYSIGFTVPPRPTSYSIPVEPADIPDFAAQFRAGDIQAIQEQELLTEELDPALKAELLVGKFKEGLHMAMAAEQAYLEKRKALIRMRLPELDLQQARTIPQLNSIVQGEIIRRVFVPHPVAENCPGTFRNGICRPNGEFTDLTWKLYRRAYRMDAVGEVIFDTRL